MPTVSIYDLKIHPRENDLIVGTHGRSLWILDDISPLQQWTGQVAKSKVHLFDQKESTLWNNISRGGQRGHFWFAGTNPKAINNTSSIPRAVFKNMACITYFVGPNVQDSIILEISDIAGVTSKQLKLAPTSGINKYYWDREFDAPEFTSEENQELDAIMETIVNTYSNSTVKRMHAGYKNAKSSDRKRRIVEPLTNGYLSFPVDSKFLIPRAEVGTYKLKLSDGNDSSQNTLVIRDDPMN